MNVLIELQIRNKIAEREANTAAANRELQSGDGWLWDHGRRDAELAEEIDKLFAQAEERNEHEADYSRMDVSTRQA